MSKFLLTFPQVKNKLTTIFTKTIIKQLSINKSPHNFKKLSVHLYYAPIFNGNRFNQWYSLINNHPFRKNII